MKLDYLSRRFCSASALAAIAAGTVLSTAAQAESLGLLTARSADVSEYSQVSIEGSAKFGDFDFFGARATLGMDGGLALFADFGMLDDDDLEDATAYGAGLIYEIEGVSSEVNTAIVASYHVAPFDDFDADFSSLGVRGLMSGALDAQSSVPLTWFASLGFERVAVEVEQCFNVGFGTTVCAKEDDDDIELALGAGIIAAAGPGEAYVGIDYVDDASLAIGYRMNF